MMGSGYHIPLKEKAEIVKMFLPDCTLNTDGKVVKADTCPLCGGMIDTWSATNEVELNGKPVLVHQICSRGNR